MDPAIKSQDDPVFEPKKDCSLSLPEVARNDAKWLCPTLFSGYRIIVQIAFLSSTQLPQVTE
jgi:hypothetical protein